MRHVTRWGAAMIGLLSTPWLAWANQAGDSGYGHGQMWHGGWTGMVFGPLMIIFFIALTVAVVVLIVRWLSQLAAMHGPKPKAALDILEERFARGEIDKEEFEARRQALQG